jgi:ABC-2 type transport system permease protein
VRRKQLVAFLEIGKDALRPPDPADDTAARVSYYTNAGGIDEMRNWLNGPINDGVRLARLAQLGIDIDRNKGLTASVPIDGLSLVERDEKTGEVHEAQKRGELEGFFVPFAVAMILAMIVMVGSAPMLQNVTQDKSQRIVETLLGAATPFELMTGKVLGSVGVSVTSSVLYVLAGTFAVNALGIAGLLPLSIIPWFYVYLLADVVMLCAFAAALGACCSTPQDAQNLAIVLLMPCLIPMFMLVTVLRQPNGALATVMSLIPPFTPILMLLRQAMPTGVPAWQPWVGLVGVLLFAAATVWAASRIFRVAILMQGKPPRLAEMVRWAMKG